MDYVYRYNEYGQLFRKKPDSDPQEYNYKTKEWRFTSAAADVFFGYDYSNTCSAEYANQLIERNGVIDKK